MWPFNKKSKNKIVEMNPADINFSQVDITGSLNDKINLRQEEWIKTIRLNLNVHNPESSGLPPVNSSDEKTYEIAKNLSKIRESFHLPNDGVYCPICNIANKELNKLHTPCPKCGRSLLQFGWT